MKTFLLYMKKLYVELRFMSPNVNKFKIDLLKNSVLWLYEFMYTFLIFPLLYLIRKKTDGSTKKW